MKSIDKANLSILELLEFGISWKEIYHALAKGIVGFDKAPDKLTGDEQAAAGDYYFKFLNTKVKLTSLGLRFLQHIRES